jgi:hypothetical protein
VSAHDDHLFAVMSGTRAAALRDVPPAGDIDIDGIADRAENDASRRHRERFGCDSEDGHVVVLGGTISAHVIHAQADAEDYPWAAAVATAGLLGSDRTRAAADIRRGLSRMSAPGEVSPDVDSGRVLAAWLAQDGGCLMVGAAGQAARYVCQHVRTRYRDEHLAAGWWAVIGPHMVRALTQGLSPIGEGGGRPTGDAGQRALIRWAVRRTDATGAVSRSRLATAAGVTRPTLYTWLSD